ncbi:MAG: sulfur carrier protein ThiS [Luteimonas sp.]
MNIQLNGDAREIDRNLTLQALLALEGLTGRRVAVEVNGHIIPRGRHETHGLLEGDRVEIVHALGGG